MTGGMVLLSSGGVMAGRNRFLACCSIVPYSYICTRRPSAYVFALTGSGLTLHGRTCLPGLTCPSLNKKKKTECPWVLYILWNNFIFPALTCCRLYFLL